MYWAATVVRLALLCAGAAMAKSTPRAVDTVHNITYTGLERNGIEVFLAIHYGQDTSGTNRFKPPRPAQPAPGSTIAAQSYGPACPQPLGPWVPPISLTNVTEISEDCLHLNVARPRGAKPGDKHAVLVYIHGGSFWAGQSRDETILPDGMVLESELNGLPVIHVALNYRLNFFGFAQSDALKSEGSENAGLRDQRLAIEWVRDNIEYFGGDPDRITIFGQSSGGLAVGMQVMAYGATKPVPFHQAICESQALEPGITGNFTSDATKLVIDYVGCNSTEPGSEETVECLRSLDLDTLLNATIQTYASDIAHNIGDIWLPVVDGDFLPAPPSKLIKDGRFANITTMIGWCQNDVTFFTDFTITTPEDTRNFIQSYLPDLSSGNVDHLLSLYPASEFPADAAANLSSEFYRSARIFRDVLMTCQPIYYAEHIGAAGNDVYLYEWNQTILDPILEYLYGVTGLGTIHTSEFAYTFGNLSHYDTNGYPFHPGPEDYALQSRGSRSWSTFASTGKPGLEGHDTFQGFNPAFPGGSLNQTYIFVAGGPNEGLSAIDGKCSKAEVQAQRLRERCAFINSPEVIEQLRY